METQDQKQALENGLNYSDLKNVKVYQHIVQDKRKTKAKFFLQIGQNTISPTLEYNEMNHFILGMSRAKQLQSPEATPKHYSQDEILKASFNIKTYGGGFIKSLAECLLKADANNQKKLTATFQSEIEKYLNI